MSGRRAPLYSGWGPPEDVVDWEALVQDGEEHLAQLAGGQRGIEGELNHRILRRLHPAELLIDTWELLCVACFFYRLLVRVVENLLVGGGTEILLVIFDTACLVSCFFFKSRVRVYLISIVNSLVSWWFWVRTPVCPPSDSLTAKTNKMLANKAPPGLEQEYGIGLVN